MRAALNKTAKEKAALKKSIELVELPEDELEEATEPEEPEKEEAEHSISLEEIREKMVALTRAGKREEMKAIIESFGKEKLTGIPREKYPELLKKIEEVEKAE